MSTLNELLKWARYFNPETIFYLIIAGVVIGNGTASYIKRKKILSGGITVIGEIVGFKTRFGAQSQSRFPVVQFSTKEGKRIKLTYGTGGFLASFLVKGDDLGTIVPLLCFVAGCVMIIIAIRQFLSN